jgi:hypothetical protein
MSLIAGRIIALLPLILVHTVVVAAISSSDSSRQNAPHISNIENLTIAVCRLVLVG